jgi:hypothetical protein
MVRKRHLFRGNPMTRQVLMVIGSALVSFGGTGIIVVLAWLTASKVHGTLPYLLDERAEALLYLLPALMLVIAIVGAGFLASAFSTLPKESRASRNLHLHMRFHT